MTIRIKRAYEPPAPADGERILIDRLWPRGLSRRKAAIDQWMRELAPSTELRRWFAHDPERWREFKRRYFHELRAVDEQARALATRARRRRVTLVYAARDEEHSNAVALREYLRRRYRV